MLIGLARFTRAAARSGALLIVSTAMLCTALAVLPSASAAGAASSTEEPVTLNFVNADVEAVVRAVGQYTGRSFVIDPRVKGTMTLVTERPVTRRQAYEELLSALRLQGFTLVESPDAGGVARVVLEADAKLQGGRVLTPATATPRGDQVVTQVFQLQYESASNLVPVLRPLIAPNNTIAAYAATNTLVITDYADNLRRLARIIEAIDSPATSETVVIPMKYALANDIATILNHILDDAAHGAGQGGDSGQRVLVQAETRSNSVILRAASRARLEQAKALIERFDQPSATPGNINVIYLRNAQAIKLAPLLRAVLSSDPSFVAQAGGSASLSGGGTGGGTGGSSGLGGFGGSTSSGSSTGSGLGSGSSPFGGSTTTGTSTTTTTYTPGGGTDRSGLSGMIQADPASNSLIISAPEPLFKNIRAIVDKLDVRPAQVLIESLVVELSGDNASEFGVQWQSLNGLNNPGTGVIGGTNFAGTGQNILGAAENLSSLGQGFNFGIVNGSINIPGVGSVTNIGLLARALETKANANILERPNIQTLDNEEGKFLVGQNVPFVTGSYANTGTTTTTSTASTVTPFQTYERHDVGLLLRVKPQISEGGTVRLQIYIEDSSVSSGTSGTDLILNKRSFETSVIVNDGNFVVISGMIQDQVNENQYKVPVLGDIPWIGALFRYDTREHIKTQTMVFLRPKVIRDETASREVVADRYEYIRNELIKSEPDHNLVLRDMALERLPPLPANPGAGGAAVPPSGAAVPHAPATEAAPAADSARIVVAVVVNEDQARWVQQQVKDLGMTVHWEPLPESSGGTPHLRVLVDSSPHRTEETMTILRGLGFAPTLAGAGTATAP
jgi:general secretion pathway protein D